MSETVLITGSRKGIGRNLCEYFLSNGKKVIGCSRSPSDLKHKNYYHFCLNISQENDVLNLFSEIRKLGFGLDILINNAGISNLNHIILTPYTTAKDIFDTNLLGTFLMCREASKIMMKKRKGRIVNFTSVAVPLKIEGEALYASSKAAVTSLTQILAKELGHLGITVNALGPTPIETDLIKGIPKSKINKIIDQQAIKRLGTYQDVVFTVEYFCSAQADFISGQVIYLGGVT